MNIYYGDKGWHLETPDGNFATDFQLRLQLRYSYPFEVNPASLEDFNTEKKQILQIRRARVKIGGNAFTPKLRYYMEYELAASILLDFWASYSFNKALKIQFGQYKARYNTERVVSSGRQQTAERSILTRPFTIDRQTGLTVFGNLNGRGALNFSYWMAVFSGTGRGKFIPDDDVLMWKFRGQWNMFGEEMSFVSSDIEQLSAWRGYLAGGFVTNQSQFTRFSQNGGGQLIGYPDTSQAGQYRINQFFIETAFKKSGFSWQQEFHWKRIHDNLANTSRTLDGNYFQLGTFPVTYIKKFPEQLELAARYAFYIPDLSTTKSKVEEFTFSLNWFFKGHSNKLTTDISYLELEDNDIIKPGWRFRFQWDVSF
jgi:phosphate-selective porin OprO/OprP